jgi:hypothetical protein
VSGATRLRRIRIYGFSLERHVPDNHMLRGIDRFVDLSEVRAHLASYGRGRDFEEPVRRDSPNDRKSQAALVLRSRAKRGVSKDAPGGANEAASWTILRDAMLRIAPQDEAVELAPAVVGITLGVTKAASVTRSTQTDGRRAPRRHRTGRSSPRDGRS